MQIPKRFVYLIYQTRNMSKVIKQTGEIKFQTNNHWYKIELIMDEYTPLGWNVSSSSGINHYENGLLHKTFDQAYKYMKQAIKNEEA